MTDLQVSIMSSSETTVSIPEIPEIVITDILGQSHPIYLKSRNRVCLKVEDFKLPDLSLQIAMPNFKSNKTQIIIGKGRNELILAENKEIKFVLLFDTKLNEVFYNQICMQLAQISKKYCQDIYEILFKEWSSHQTEIQKHSSHVDVLKYYIIDFLHRFQQIGDSIYDIYIKFFKKTPENKDNMLFISRFKEIYSNENSFILKILYEAMTTTENGVSLLLDFTDEKFTDKEGKQISQKKHLKNLLEPFDSRNKDEKGKKIVNAFSTINEAQLGPIFKILKSIIKVVDGFSGSMYETPIPSCAYDYDCEKFNIYCISTLFDMMSRVFFRSIGIVLTSSNFLFLISSLSMSVLNETNQTDILIESSISIKPVFESFMKDDTFFEDVCEYNISRFSTFYQWKLLKFFEKTDGKRFKKIIESDTWNMNPLNFYEIECSVFLYLFTEWWKSSSLKNIDLKEIANIFGLQDYIPFIIGHHPIKNKILKITKKDDKKIKFTIAKQPANRSCHDWLFNINQIHKEKETSFIPCSSLEIISDSPYINISGLILKIIEEQLDNFKEFLTKKSFNIDNCHCCGSDFTSINKKYWHTFPCSQCTIPPKICIDCYKKSTVLLGGHQLNPQASGISCMQCNYVFPENISRFPEGTTQEQISENSEEYFSCCFIGCKHFVHIPAVEGAICGVETGVIADTFCESHTFLMTIKDNAKKCPGCGIIITKTEGCNHITCNCGAQFCFRPKCPYFVNAHVKTYQHPPYCRFGIKDVLTVAVFDYIIINLTNIPYQEITYQIERTTRIISVISQCLYYISSNGFEDPFITTIFTLQQIISSPDLCYRIPALIREISGHLDLLFGHFTKQEMLDAIRESVEESNTTLFDNYIAYLSASINSQVQVDDSARTPDGQLIEVPSSDQDENDDDEDEDEYVAPPPLEPLIHHQIDVQVPPPPPQVQIQQENNWVHQENDWAQQNIDWGIGSDDEDIQAINVALLQQFAENQGIPPRQLEDAPLSFDNSTSDEDDEEQENVVDENDDEILERAIELHQASHF